ncbi:SulP family inorganic anion transporter [Aquirhabdus parva]|uniref:SulP family inorganic anion transporter n=1 Tax=Aquirhabdus parva TaxID=2283318 RepID=A0A345P3V1_9GAMM|nr:SulP family inorganic anion transporter [Aquirhabdus parva]AXI01960.1 SulP family inorganic anion transporter [Aquirhabdus parva]
MTNPTQSLAANPSRLADLVAGLSIAGLLLPEAVAYSGIAGMPPQAGVIALLIGLLCYGFIGTSRFAIVSATSSSAAVLVAAVSSMAGPDLSLRLLLASGLVILTGVFFILASVAKLGEASNFIAKPVLRGFAVGLAITIVIKQFPNIIAIHPTHSDIFRYVNDLIIASPQWNLTGLLIAVVALTLLKVLATWRAVPGALIVIAAGIALDVSGFTTSHGVAAVGTINLSLSMPTIPDLTRTEWLRLGELAVAMVMILYAESYGAIRTFAIQHGDPSAPNRDLMAFGIANIASGLFQGMPVGAGYSATSANESAGAQSRWSGWIAAIVVLILVLTLLPWIEHTPEPVLAAIVIHAVSHNISWQTFRPYFLWHRDRIIVISALVAVLVLGVLDGLLAAIGVSLIMMLRNLSESRVAWLGELGDTRDYVDIKRHPDAKTLPNVLIARPESSLFFANAERIFGMIHDQVLNLPATQIVIISFEESPNLDSTSLEALRDFADAMQKKEVKLLLARVKDPLRDILQRANFPEIPASCYDPRSVYDAVSEARAQNTSATSEQTSSS